MGRSKSSPRTLLALERRKKAIQLRREGKTYDEIAQELGISTPRAFTIIKQEMEKLRTELAEDVTELRQIAADQLNGLMAVEYPKALKAEGAVQEKAQKMVLSIIDRQARLFGWDAAQKSDVTLRTLETMTNQELLDHAKELGLVAPTQGES